VFMRVCVFRVDRCPERREDTIIPPVVGIFAFRIHAVDFGSRGVRAYVTDRFREEIADDSFVRFPERFNGDDILPILIVCRPSGLKSGTTFEIGKYNEIRSGRRSAVE